MENIAKGLLVLEFQATAVLCPLFRDTCIDNMIYLSCWITAIWYL